MRSMLGGNSYLLAEAQRLAGEEKKVINMMTLFPAVQYQSHPTYEQFATFIYDAASEGYTLDSLYSMFASGQMDSAIDALIRKHAQGWRPVGKIVDAANDLKEQ